MEDIQEVRERKQAEHPEEQPIPVEIRVDDASGERPNDVQDSDKQPDA